MTSLTVIILTFNEELHIQRCIESVKDIAQQIIVVDSFSTDKTIDIATSLGVEVVQHEFINQAQQFQWVLDTYPIKKTWVLRLDADEYLLPELVEEIQRRLPSLPESTTGIYLNRRHIHMERWIRHGTRYPLILLRMWRKGKGRVEQRWMDEHIVLLEGNSITFDHDFCDHNLNNTTWWIDKHNKYATREAIDVLNQKYQLVSQDRAMTENNKFSQASLKRLIKDHIYNHIPLFIGPMLYFLYRYFIRLGFLDGKEGVIYHFLQGFWYRFLVEVKIVEIDRVLRPLPNKHSRLKKLEELTGCSLQ
jgi:glycosyltransferase involved in cell wall biosynthesis